MDFGSTKGKLKVGMADRFLYEYATNIQVDHRMLKHSIVHKSFIECPTCSISHDAKEGGEGVQVLTS